MWCIFVAAEMEQPKMDPETTEWRRKSRGGAEVCRGELRGHCLRQRWSGPSQKESRYSEAGGAMARVIRGEKERGHGEGGAMSAFLYTAQSFSFHNPLALSDSPLLEFTFKTLRAEGRCKLQNRTECTNHLWKMNRIWILFHCCYVKFAMAAISVCENVQGGCLWGRIPHNYSLMVPWHREKAFLTVNQNLTVWCQTMCHWRQVLMSAKHQLVLLISFASLVEDGPSRMSWCGTGVILSSFWTAQTLMARMGAKAALIPFRCGTAVSQIRSKVGRCSLCCSNSLTCINVMRGEV